MGPAWACRAGFVLPQFTLYDFVGPIHTLYGTLYLHCKLIYTIIIVETLDVICSVMYLNEWIQKTKEKSTHKNNDKC